MAEQENLAGKYYGQVSNWDNSVEKLTFENRYDIKSIYKVIGIHTQKENTEEVLYNVKVIRFESNAILDWAMKVYSAKNLKERFTELTRKHVEELRSIVIDNIFNK